ncbi:two-component sensor histidine kinase [Tsukamurella asaccharolytica]|uniref:histidine kinase n=1 Tax=Tsukamurella asaccharolytica TaxID=2592067 RepID=A0A5C5RDJ8_9ACTN|nr:two-component sensor histidine kinase [Tsukamurella asaccharolytica]
MLITAAGADAALTPASAVHLWFAVSVAVIAVAVRRRWPIAAFLGSIFALFASSAMIAVVITLFNVATRFDQRRLLGSFAAIAAIGYIWTTLQITETAIDFSVYTASDAVIVGLYATMTAVAPIVMGRLVRTREELRERLIDIEQVREHERQLDAQAILAKERNQLAREMHDVVSHQVSLIAVQAAALQVSSPDPAAKETAGTLRRLAVNTLEELRHMVNLLRASGGTGSGLHPQPTLTDLERLIDTSGIETRLDDNAARSDLDPALQRAVYRTVQEALTNVRKHAPGSSAVVKIDHTATALNVTITNTRPTRPVLALPSARHGLIGLQERAALLGGVMSTEETSDGGFRLSVSLPTRTSTQETTAAPGADGDRRPLSEQRRRSDSSQEQL